MITLHLTDHGSTESDTATAEHLHVVFVFVHPITPCPCPCPPLSRDPPLFRLDQVSSVQDRLVVLGNW